MSQALFGYFSVLVFLFMSEALRNAPVLEEDLVVRGRRLPSRPFWSTFFLTSILGLCLSMADLIVSTPFPLELPVLVCFVITLCLAGIVIGFKANWFGAGSAVTSEAAASRRWWRLRNAAALAVFVLAFALGAHFDKEDSVTPVSMAPYHVSGTYTDGSGFVNVCREPAPCAGQDPIGRLEEGDPVFIECQLSGKATESISNATSRIWNRLVGGGFVSDLFVDTPGEGRFSPDLPRCAPWAW